MASEVPRKYLRPSGTEANSHGSDHILARFEAISKKLEANSTALTNPESISLFYDLSDVLTEWRILRDQKKSIKSIFPFQDYVAQMNLELRSDIEAKLNVLERSLELEASSNQPNLLQLDRYTFYKRNGIEHDPVSDEREKQLVSWLLAPGDFKTVGISGTGDSGKTMLVKNVLKQKSVQDKFKCVIWACLSQSADEEEMERDVRIIEYLLYRLGLDTDDNLVADVEDYRDCLGKTKKEEDYRDWLMKELKRRLRNSGNYILVFDDMWQCSVWFAGDFLGKLKENGGGAVIVTSRKKAVAEKIAPNNMRIHLKPWDDYKESGFMKDKDSDLGK